MREEILAIGPPWFNGEVRLDRERFTPVVDGQTFDQLGGGVKAAINVAFSFGLARYAFGTGENVALLPRFLIVDAIRKNIGSNDEDGAFATRLYQRAFFLADRLEVPGGQVLVLDNDGWPPVRHLRDYPYKPVNLSYEEPLVLGVSHADTGEDPHAPDEHE